MNDEIGLLLVIAPIAVAFAGFGSIATAFAAQRQSGETRIASTRLINMLQTSLQVAFLALMPAALSLFAIPERWLWGSSAAVCLLSLAILAPPGIIRSFRMTHAAGVSFSWTAWALALALTGGNTAAAVLALLDLPAGQAGAMLCRRADVHVGHLGHAVRPGGVRDPAAPRPQYAVSGPARRASDSLICRYPQTLPASKQPLTLVG